MQDILEEELSPEIFSGLTLSFNTSVAKVCGLNAAVVLNHIKYWLIQNYKHKKCIVDGKVWMFESHAQIADFFEFLTEKQVRDAINVLVEKRILVKKNLSQNKFNKTYWYTLEDEYFQKVFPKRRNCRIESNILKHDVVDNEGLKECLRSDEIVGSERPPGRMYIKSNNQRVINSNACNTHARENPTSDQEKGAHSTSSHGAVLCSLDEDEKKKFDIIKSWNTGTYDKTIIEWIRTHTFEKIRSAYEQAREQSTSNPGGLMAKKLSDGFRFVPEDAKKSLRFCIEFEKRCDKAGMYFDYDDETYEYFFHESVGDSFLYTPHLQFVEMCERKLSDWEKYNGKK